MQYFKVDLIRQIIFYCKFSVFKTKSLRKHRFAESEEDWKVDEIELRKLLTNYMMLSKSRLTTLVAITSVAGYSMAPNIIFDPVILVSNRDFN